MAFFAAVGGSWVRVGIAIAAACLGGAILGGQEDKFLSDISGVDPQPGISQIVGCVGGSTGFFGGGGVVIQGLAGP